MTTFELIHVRAAQMRLSRREKVLEWERHRFELFAQETKEADREMEEATVGDS